MTIRRTPRALPTLSAALMLALAVSAPALAVTIDWVTVGGPGNACDSQTQGCFGSVANTYRISKYETTNAQYAEFLNSVAATDTHGLYQTDMGSAARGGITGPERQGISPTPSRRTWVTSL